MSERFVCSFDCSACGAVAEVWAVPTKNEGVYQNETRWPQGAPCKLVDGWKCSKGHQLVQRRA